MNKEKEIENKNIELSTKINEIKRVTDINADYDFIRENLKKVIESGNDILESSVEAAKDSDHPRSFEAASSIMKTLIDANHELVATQKTMTEIYKNIKESTYIENNENNFSNTNMLNSNELLNLIKKGKKSQKIDE